MAEQTRSHRLFSEIMATGMEKTMDETESDIFSDSRKNLSAVFKKAGSSNVEPGGEHMKCYLRVRPFSDGEAERGENQGCIEILDGNTIMTNAPKDSHIFKNYSHGLGKTSHKFTFSRIFDEDTTQKEFFDDTMLNLVRDFINGQNCLVFTYGVTSSGKTYTIQGKQSDAGILPRVLDVLFNSINNKQCEGMNLKPNMFMDVTKLNTEQEEIERKIKDRIMKMSTEDDNNVMMLLGDDASDMSQGNTTTCSEGSNISVAVGRESKESLESDVFDIENRIREETKLSVEDQGQIRFSIWCSFAEIYNEQIFDLLESIPKKKNAKRPVLRLSDDKNGNPYIKGLKELNVTNADEAYKLLNVGQRNLRTAQTKLNQNSSRSHCIFNIKIIRVVDNGHPKCARVSMLSLCDLAGSERSSKTLSQGERLKEAGNINTSLMTLGRCIEMLRFNQNHKDNRIIPFRDSKLTRLLQNYFTGKGKAAMIVNVNQCASMFDETLHVFKFSAIAKQVVVHQKPDMLKSKAISSTLRCRDPSIQWDTPGAMMKYNSQFTDTEEVDEEDGDGNLDVSMSELQEALNLVELLQNQLQGERKSKVLMEARIRDEVCLEMMQQLVSIEENYNVMIRENKQQHEVLVEERVKMLMESIHQPRKRARGDKNDENTDEWVSSIRLKAEECKVKDFSSRCDSMSKEIVELKAEIFRLTKAQESMTKIQTALEFQVADSKTSISNLLVKKEKSESSLKELEKDHKVVLKTVEDLKLQLQQAIAASGGSGDDVGNTVLLETLCQQLQETRDSLRKQEREIAELNEMLTEAGDTFNQKEKEIVKLKIAIAEDEEKIVQQAQVIVDMQNMLEESKTVVETSQARLQDKDDKILTLEGSCSQKQVKIENLTRQLKELESLEDGDKSNCGDVETNLQQSEKELEKLNETLIDKESEIEALQNKLKLEEEESFKRHQALIHGYNAEINSYKTQTLELRAKLVGFQKTGNELEKTKEQAKSFKNELLDQVKDLQKELMKYSAMTAELEQGLKIAKSTVEDLEQRLETEKDKHVVTKKQVSELETKIKTVVEEKDEKILNHKKNARTLRTELRDLQDSVKTKDSDLENIKIKMADVEIDLEKEEEEKESVVNELERLKELVQEKDKCIGYQDNHSDIKTVKHDIERLKEVLEEKNELMKKLSEEKNKLKEDVERLNELVQEKEELIKSGIEGQENIVKLKIELDSMKELVQTKDELIVSQVSEIEKVNEDLESMNELVQEKDELIGKHEGEMELMLKLKEQMNPVMERLSQKEEEITKLEKKNEELEVVKHNLKAMINQTTGDLENKNVQLKVLETTTDNLNKLSSREKQTIVEISDLNQEIIVKNGAVANLSSELDIKNRKCLDLNSQLETQNIRVKELNSALEQKHRDMNEIGEKVLQLTENLTQQNNLTEEKVTEVKSIKFDLDEKVIEVDELNQKLTSAQQNSAELNQVIKELQSKIVCVQSTGDEQTQHFKSVSDQLLQAESSIQKLEEEKGDLSRQITILGVSLADITRESDDKVTNLQEDIQLKSSELTKIHGLYEELKDASTKYDEEQVKLTDAHLQIAELKSALHMEKTFQKKYKDETSDLENEKTSLLNQLIVKKSEMDLLKSEKSNKDQEIIKLSKQLSDEINLRQECDKKFQSFEHDAKQTQLSSSKMISSKDNELKVKDEEIEELKSKLYDVQMEYSQLSTKLETLQQEYDSATSKLSETDTSQQDSSGEHFREDLINEQMRNFKLQAAIKEYHNAETDSTPGNARRLRKEKIEAESSLINAQYEIETVTRKLRAYEKGKQVPSPKVDHDLLQKLFNAEQKNEKLCEKIETLHGTVGELSDKSENYKLSEKEEKKMVFMEKNISQLQTELKEKEQKIHELSAKTLNNDMKTSSSETSLQELKRSQERELNLRQQLKEAGETMKEHSKEIANLEDKLQNQLKEVLDLQTKLKTFENEKEDWLKESSAHQNYDEKIQELRSDIERKNSKLESKHNSNIELRQTIERERETFEVALKDAQANEVVLESLKDALTEQEDTMAKQDEILKKREDDIKLINSELDKLADRHQSLLESTGDSGRELREVTKSHTRSESEKLELEKQNSMLTQELNQLHKDGKTLEDKNKDLIQQLDAVNLEKNILDSKIKNNSVELSKFYIDLESLKNEKITLEKLITENNQCSSKLQDIKSAKTTLENDQNKFEKEKIELKSVKSELEKDKSELEKEKKELVVRNVKLSSDKETLNKVVKENNDDIMELEKVLTDSRKEVEELKNKLEEEIKMKVKEDKESHKAFVDDLKTKLRDKDSINRKFEKEGNQLKAEIEQMKKNVIEKEMEMEVWRKSRDELVGSLESLMKKQAAEIKDLKAGKVNENRKQLLDQIEEKDERIRELQEQVESAEVEFTHQQTPTRGRCRKRSHIAGISIVEIDNMRKQLEKEREEKLIMQRNLQMMQKAKDCIITDIRTSNHLLQGIDPPPTPPPPTPTSVKLEPTFENDDEDISDHMQLDVTPSVAVKGRRNARKRVSASSEPEPQVLKTRRRGRNAGKLVKTEPEDVAIDLDQIKEEEETEDEVGRRPGRRAKASAKGKIGEVLNVIGSPITRSAKKSGSTEIFVADTPVEVESKSRGGRKKRILYNTEEIHITPPFECGAFVPSSITPESCRASTRLRGRKQSAV